MNLNDVINALEDVRYHLTGSKHKRVIDDAVALLHRQNYEIDRLLIENEKAIQEGLTLPDRLVIDSKARYETVKEYNTRLKEDLKLRCASHWALLRYDDVMLAMLKVSNEMVGANNGNTEKDN